MPPPRRREAVRRVAVGLVLCLAAGAGVGDEVRSAPDGRRGTRVLRLDLPHLGTTYAHVPQAVPSGVVLLVRGTDARGPRAALLEAIPSQALVVDIDGQRLAADAPGCTGLATRLEDISRRAQRDVGVPRYLPPVIVAAGDAVQSAARAMAAGGRRAFPAAVAVGTSRVPDRPTCSDGPETDTHTRWRSAADDDALGLPLSHALREAAHAPPAGQTAVERWLQHFELPLTAAWSSAPRGMLVLLSPAHGWRASDDALAASLAATGIHVVGIDALQSFWQRRSPREVALELQRLTDALATTGLPVYIGGREFGAETMAVAGEMMPPTRKLAGIVLIDPGPSAFFEVEPPALALRPLGPREWSTRAALSRLDRPTLCVTHAASSPADLLCRSLSGRGQATRLETGANAAALARGIARFILPGS